MEELSSVAQQLISGLGWLVSRFLDHTQTHMRALAIGPFWTKYQPVAEATTYTTHNKNNKRKSMLTARFEHAVLAIKRQHTYAFDLPATHIGPWKKLMEGNGNISPPQQTSRFCI